MKRRKAIKAIAVIGAGAWLVPACRETGQAAFPLKNFSVSKEQEQMLESLCDFIIPKSNDFVGAKDLRSHEFLLKMMDDCQPPERQQQFTEGLKAFEERCSNKFNNPFYKCTAQQRSSLLKELETTKDESDEAANLYRVAKGYTLQSFTSSKDYMTDIRKYKMVPGGNFKGCVKV